MPLWPVHLRPWTAGTIPAFVPEEVLSEFEEPLTTTIRDASGTLLLAHLLSRGDGKLRYVAVPTTETMIEQLKGGLRSVHEALDQPLVWLLDVEAEGSVTETWVGSFSELPARVLPVRGTMLYPHLMPMLRLRAVGYRINPNLLPADVVTSLVGGAQRSVRRLIRHVAGTGSSGRPPEWVRALYQLRAQQFAFNSFEVAFRPNDLEALLPDIAGEAARAVAEAERLLALGIEWASTGHLEAEDDEERLVILQAVRDLAPSQGSDVRYTEVGGRVVADKVRVSDRPQLNSGTRRRAGEAIKSLQAGKQLPEYAARIGYIEAVDVGKRLVTIRADDGESIFSYEEEFEPEVLDYLNSQELVNSAAARFGSDYLLVSILSVQDRQEKV